MSNEQLVTRTYRAAIRVGEDFITLEETVALPINATDDEVQRAVDLGWRIYRAQREAVEEQAQEARQGRAAALPASNGNGASYAPRDPDAPASDKQRNYIARLQDDLGWSGGQLASYAAEQGVDLVTLTKGQASTFIDGMKQLAEAHKAGIKAAPRAEYGAPPPLRLPGFGDDAPPPEPTGDEGQDIPF